MSTAPEFQSACPAENRRRSYPSDITDAQWRKVRELLPANSRCTGRRRATDLREVLSAIAYRRKTGCAWRMLPHDFPPWGTVYSYEREWRRSGVLKKVREQLRQTG